MNKQLLKIAALTSSTTVTLALIECFPGPAIAIESLWNFEFMGEITGTGTVQLDLEDQDVGTGSFLVTDLDFSLDFGVGGDPQSISLGNFLTQPLRFNPNNPSNELFSTLVGFLQPGWNLGIVPPDGLFPGGGLTMSGSSGAGLPPDPSGIGGTISFTTTGGSPDDIRTGTWTAPTQSVPEPSGVLGLTLAIGIGTLVTNRKRTNNGS